MKKQKLEKNNFLEGSVKQFHLIWEKSIDGMRIMNKDGIIEMVNDSFCKMVELTREELIGKPFTVCYDKRYAEEMLRKEKERIDSNTIEIVFERKLILWNGKEVVFELSNSIWELPNQDIKIFSIIHDITKRRNAEEDLKRVNDELEFRVKLRTAELDTLNLRLKKELEEKAKVEQSMKMYLRELEMNKILLEQDENELKMINDKLIESEIKLKKSNTNKYVFLSLMSEEISKPLTSIQSISDNILRLAKKLDKKEIYEEAKALNVTNAKLNSLLENIKFWLKIQTNEIEFIPKSTDLHKVVETAIENVKDVSSSKGIKIINLTQPSTFIVADVELLLIVLNHLINNSIKFSNKNSEIKIYSKNNYDFEEIIIEDNGLGMTKEISEKIFHLDKRFSTKDTENQQGSGLGLILCKELINKHSGNIRIESEKNKGTKVIFSLNKAF